MDKIIETLKKTKTPLESLNLSMLTTYDIKGSLNPFYGRKFTREDIQEIEKETTIRHIFFDYTSFDDFDMLPNLDLLSLGLNGCEIGDEFITKLPDKYPNLQGLYVKDIKFNKKILESFKNVVQLEVDYDDIRDVLWLFSVNRNLETINGIDWFGNGPGYSSTSENDDNESVMTNNSKFNK